MNWGQSLHEKINAPNRIKDPNYKGKATNTKEYVKESILCPGCYVVFNEEAGESLSGWFNAYNLLTAAFSEGDLDKLVDFISQTEAPAGS